MKTVRMRRQGNPVARALKWLAGLWVGGVVGIVIIAFWLAGIFAVILGSSCMVYLLWEFGRWLIG